MLEITCISHQIHFRSNANLNKLKTDILKVDVQIISKIWMQNDSNNFIHNFFKQNCTTKTCGTCGNLTVSYIKCNINQPCQVGWPIHESEFLWQIKSTKFYQMLELNLTNNDVTLISNYKI